MNTSFWITWLAVLAGSHTASGTIYGLRAGPVAVAGE